MKNFKNFITQKYPFHTRLKCSDLSAPDFAKTGLLIRDSCFFSLMKRKMKALFVGFCRWCVERRLGTMIAGYATFF